MTEWGPWAEPTPLPEAPGPVTPETCVVMRPRLVQARSGLWEAQPAVFRAKPGLSWQTACRVGAWARPRESDDWWFALTYLTTCYLATGKPTGHGGPVHTHPRWRTAWMVFDPRLLRTAEPPKRYPSDYWREQLSNALGEFAAEIGVSGRSA